MSSIDDLTDEEYGRLCRQVRKIEREKGVEKFNTKKAVCVFLRAAGLGSIADLVEVAVGAWETIRSIWRGIFG